MILCYKNKWWVQPVNRYSMILSTAKINIWGNELCYLNIIFKYYLFFSISNDNLSGNIIIFVKPEGICSFKK